MLEISKLQCVRKIKRNGGFLCDIYHQLLKGEGEGEPCDIGKYVNTSWERHNPQLKKKTIFIIHFSHARLS